MCEAIEEIKEGRNEMIDALRANGTSEELIQVTLRTFEENNVK